MLWRLFDPIIACTQICSCGDEVNESLSPGPSRNRQVEMVDQVASCRQITKNLFELVQLITNIAIQALAVTRCIVFASAFEASSSLASSMTTLRLLRGFSPMSETMLPTFSSLSTHVLLESYQQWYLGH